jgi:hypothetical protein
MDPNAALLEALAIARRFTAWDVASDDYKE